MEPQAGPGTARRGRGIGYTARQAPHGSQRHLPYLHRAERGGCGHGGAEHGVWGWGGSRFSPCHLTAQPGHLCPGAGPWSPRFTLRARYSKCFRREHGQSPPWREDGGAHLSLRKLTRGTLKKLAEGDGDNKCELGLQPTLRAGPALFSLQSCPGVL